MNAEMDALYAELPGIDCQGRCWDSCGPIDMTRLERARIRREKDVLIPVGSFVEDGPVMCPALTMFRQCGVYEIRPLICRIWGLAETMPCTYGCKPERYLNDVEMYEFLARAYDIAGEHKLARLVRAANLPENRAELAKLREQVLLQSHVKAREMGLPW